MKRAYALEKGGPKNLEFNWGIGWKDFTVSQDGNQIGSFADQKELKQGKEFTLKDGSRLYVKLSIGLMSSGLEILRDGKPIEGSDADPSTRVKGCFGLLLFIAILDVIGAAILVLAPAESSSAKADNLIFGFVFLFLGFIYIFLALIVKKASLTGLYIAITVVVLEILLGIALLAMAGSVGSIFWAVIRVMVVIYLVTSVKFFKEAGSKTGLT